MSKNKAQKKIKIPRRREREKVLLPAALEHSGVMNFTWESYPQFR